jgi:prepilin-type N-terminal cleavage/methylation domain-containing protein
MNTNRKGFSLVELIIVVVLGSLILAAAMKVLITNQRTYTAQSAQIKSQEATRATLDILSAELREISAQGGDLITMGTNSIKVRSMQKFGVVCDTSSTSSPKVKMIKLGDWIDVGDSVFVFADINTSTGTDDTWIPAQVTGVDTTSVSCSSSAAEWITLGGHPADLTRDSVRPGAPVRSYVHYTYGLMTMDGDTYLARTDDSGSQVPLIGPLASSGGIAFAYLDQDGNVTATATSVRQIQVTVRAPAGPMNSLGGQTTDSITGRIYTRN